MMLSTILRSARGARGEWFSGRLDRIHFIVKTKIVLNFQRGKIGTRYNYNGT